MHWRCIATYGDVLWYRLQNVVTLCHAKSQQDAWSPQHCKHMDNTSLGYIRCSEAYVHALFQPKLCPSMVGRSKPEAKKQQEASNEKAEVQKIAVERYRTELLKPINDRKGARKICEEVTIEHKNLTGRLIHLNHATVIRHVDGGRTMQEFNAEKRWLSTEEEKVVLGFVEETAVRGFPLSHRHLREHVDMIIQARVPTFPGVGEQWTNRFVLRHSDRIQTIWSSSLEGARARVANPTNNREWFELLHTHLENVEPDCIWAADETGIQTGAAVHERVIGRKGKNLQHQTRQGTHENITVIVTIAADGTSIPPAIIYKGQGFLASWKQDNPLGAS